VLANADSFSGDASRVAVMGESAGGNLAINTAIAARDQKLQAPMHQVLVYPVAGVNTDTPSYRENEKAKPLNKAMIGWFVGHLTNGEQDKQDPRLDILGKADLSGLPSATIITAQIDPLTSDGEQLTDRLSKAGVPVRHQHYQGVTHEFFGMNAVVAKAETAQAFAAEELKNGFDKAGRASN
jgi:acetyl esterase